MGTDEITVQRQQALSVIYGNLTIDSGYRVALLIEDAVVELKSVTGLDRVHIARLLTYLKLSGCRAGLLIDFNTPLLRDGSERLVV